MPKRPGMLVFPNSAPNSLTPNHWKTEDLVVLDGRVTLKDGFGTGVVLVGTAVDEVPLGLVSGVGTTRIVLMEVEPVERMLDGATVG